MDNRKIYINNRLAFKLVIFSHFMNICFFAEGGFMDFISNKEKGSSDLGIAILLF